MVLFKKKKSENSLMNILPEVKGEYLLNEPLNKYTWFGVGGPAEVMYCPKDTNDLCHFMKNKPYNLPVFVIGGKHDLVLTGEASEEIAEKLGCACYMYEDLGHSAYEEAPDFNRRVLEFFKNGEE